MSRDSATGLDEGCEHAGLAVAHALWAAEPEDELTLVDHLPHCTVCRSVLDDSEALAATLGAAVPIQEPPPGLRTRLLAEARVTPPRATPSAPTSASAVSGASAAAGASTGGRTPDRATGGAAPGPDPQASGAGRIGRASRGLVLVGAAVVLAVVLLAGQVLLSGSPERTTAGPDADRSSSAALADQAQDVVTRAEEQDPGVRHAMLRSRDGRTIGVVLAGGPDEGSDPAGQQGGVEPRVVPLDMPTPGADESMVLWGTSGTGDAGPVAIGVVDPSTGRSSGTAGAEPEAPEGGWRGYAVSVEPGQVPPESPTRVVAAGGVSA